MSDEEQTLREELVPQVVEAVREDEVDLAWEMVKAARQLEPPAEDVGTLAGLEVALEAVADAEAGKETLDDLLAGKLEGDILHGLGCTLPDMGQGLDFELFLEWADRVFGQAEEQGEGAGFVANRAIVLKRLGRVSEAVEAYARALVLEPDWLFIRLVRSVLHREMGSHDEAAADLAAWLEENPADVFNRVWLAIAHSEAGRYEEAAAQYARAAEDDPDNVSLHFNWLITAQRMEDVELAKREAARIEELDPADWRAGLGEAIVLGLQDRHPEAVARARAVFDAVAAEESSDDRAQDKEQLALIAGWVVGLARDGGVLEELLPFFDRLFETWTFPRVALDAYRRLQGSDSTVLADYWVGVEAVRDFDGESRAYRIAYRLLAEDAAQARREAVAFEHRCGATRARAAESEEMDGAADEEYPGAWWRGDIIGFFPVEEFEEDQE